VKEGVAVVVANKRDLPSSVSPNLSAGTTEVFGRGAWGAEERHEEKEGNSSRYEASSFRAAMKLELALTSRETSTQPSWTRSIGWRWPLLL